MHFVRILAAACLVLGPTLSSAQSSAPAADPLDPRASVPPLPALNVLAGYMPFQAQAIAPWRESNAQVTPPAGKEGPGANAGMSMPASTPAAKPAAGGHGHHH
ncbi:hypothetical protein OR16_02175 [Cupriavidus basilensis OR16]|uniref:Uncharacterized protein n=1 Tax=Cupriavidus basilensis OR16 TaxID=1127483 RepID=H1RYT5_9BURK|nr:hypothetical protein [Cupriavidus basilensis]EHP44776.1 hypothetical protein OR16_02175 [Cupriavidus basilensis OR16]